MLVLWEKDEINVKELSNRLQQESGSLSPVLKRMQNEGFLIRQRDPMDERNLILKLTKNGQELKEHAKLINNQFGAACGISNEEAFSLLNLLVSLRSRLIPQLSI
jgi:DNA-binding MarR family transcriptional regulator